MSEEISNREIIRIMKTNNLIFETRNAAVNLWNQPVITGRMKGKKEKGNHGPTTRCSSHPQPWTNRKILETNHGGFLWAFTYSTLTVSGRTVYRPLTIHS